VAEQQAAVTAAGLKNALLGRLHHVNRVRHVSQAMTFSVCATGVKNLLAGEQQPRSHGHSYDILLSRPAPSCLLSFVCIHI